MSESEESVGIVEALEDFVQDNPELEELEAILDDFNPFTALRLTRQELRHSAFVRWLMDPRETHGLGPYFLRSILKFLAKAGGETPAGSVIEIDSWTHESTSVHAEWQNIDVFVRDDRIGLIVVIENKVDTGEHSAQLQRYRSLVERQFPSYQRFFGYLTINRDEPSDTSYVPITHGDVAAIVEKALERRHHQIAPDVATFLRHYVAMIRRHVLEDSDVQELCRKIYATHQRALDVIFENRPDRAADVYELLLTIIGDRTDVKLAPSRKSWVRFIPTTLEALPKQGTGWGDSGHLILFELMQGKGDVRLKVTLGPGDEGTRGAMAARIAAQGSVFNRATTVPTRWWGFHMSPSWISKKDYREADLEYLEERLRKRFEEFATNELPGMVEAIRPSGSAE
jgi:PD-(D/E)XK nuclease superfamily protein